MSLFCPNVSSPEYKQLQNVFGEEMSYFIWNKNNGNPIHLTRNGEPSKLYDDLLDMTGDEEMATMIKGKIYTRGFTQKYGDWMNDPKEEMVDENGEPLVNRVRDIFARYPNHFEHPDAKIRANIEEYGSDIIHDWNNQYAWDLEAEFKTIKDWITRHGKREKIYEEMSFNKANSIRNQVRDKGGIARLIKMYSKEKNRAVYGVKIGYPVGLPSSLEELKTSGIYDYRLSDNIDKGYINSVLNNIADKTSVDTYELLEQLREDNADILEKRPDLATFIDAFLKEEKATAKFRLGTENENDFMWHQIIDNKHVISINKDNILEYASREAFVQAIAHELVHVVTTRALESPQDAIDFRFRNRIRALHDQVSEHTWKISGELKGERAKVLPSGFPYGLKDEYEFVSEFLTNPEFSEYLKLIQLEKNWYEKLIDYIKKFLNSIIFKNSPYIIEETVSDRVTRLVDSFMDVQSSYNPGSGQLITTSVKGTESIKDKLAKTKTSVQNRKKIAKALIDLSKDFKKPTPEEHTYTHIPTGEQFTPVTEYLSEFGYSYKDEEGVEKPELLIRGANLGTAVHRTIEGQMNDVAIDIAKETGLTVNKNALNDIKKILEMFRGQNIITLSEVVVVDMERKIAGTVDLTIIDEKGRIHIYDFKTKEIKSHQVYGATPGTMEERTNFMWYDSSRFGHSDQKKYRVQLSTYKHIIEKSLGIPVSSMNVVMLGAKVDNDNITSVELDGSFDESGMDTFTKPDEAFSRVYEEKPIKFGQKKRIENKIRDEREKIDDSATRDEFLDYQRRLKAEDKVGELLGKTKKSLKHRLEIMQSRYSFGKYRVFKNFVEELDEKETEEDAFLSIIYYASKQTDNLWEKYEAIRKKDGKFTPEILFQFRDYMLAYEQLNDLLEMANKDNTLFSDPSTIELLQDTVSKKDTLKNLFKTEGKYLIAKWLTPYYNGIRNEFKSKAAEDYRRESHRLRKKEGLTRAQVIERKGTQEQYAQDELSRVERTLDERTFNLIYEELTVASKDVGDITRWLDNMLDTSDVVASAMVNAFVQADEKARIEAIDKSIDFIDQLRALQKAYPKGELQGEKEYYSWMLEHDENGKPNQNIIKPWLNKLFEEEKAKRAELSKKYTEAEARKKLNEWRKDKTVVDNELFNEELDKHIYSLFKQNLLTEKEYTLIQDVRSVTGKSIQQLAKDGLIPDDVSDNIINWIYNNRPYYAWFAEEYRNPEWVKFMNEVGISTDQSVYMQKEDLKKSTHPKAKFYNFIEQASIEADSMLPYNFRLGFKLPGVTKLNSERIKEGQDPITYFKEVSKTDLFRRPDDTERGNEEFTDELGNVKMFLPIHYTAKVEPDNQSYDIPGIFFKFWESANNYSIKRNILAEMEMTKYFIETRQAKKRNSLGVVIKRLGLKGKVEDTDDSEGDAVLTNKTNLAAQFNDWFEMAVYGKKSKSGSLIKMGDKLEFDINKAADTLNRYTSLNLLGFNVVQGTANVMIGETMQAIDAIAGEHVTAKNLTTGSLKYSAWLPGMLGDVGLMSPKNVGSLIIERFNILHEDPTYRVMSKSTRAGQLASTNSLYFVQQAGEHWMQGRFLFAMLDRKRAYDKNGKDLGSMLSQYYAKDGKLLIKPEVSLEKSQWTEADQTTFMRKTKGLLSRMHGEYSGLGRVAIQRMALGRMAYMFRKFVVPGVKRRWQKKQYIERLQQEVEGNYITTMRFARQLGKDLMGLKFSLMSEDWAALNTHEKANIVRTLSEVVFVVAVSILAGIFYKMEGDDDDERLYAFMAYQMYRLQTEMLFFSPKIDEAISILRSPMASMSVIENIIKIMGQMWSPMEEYQRGPWKGELKIKRTAINFVPLYKQYYKVRDIEEQVEWFR